MYQHFIGIDIASKDFVLNVYESNRSESFPNNTKGFNQLVSKHKSILNQSLVVLETTGEHEMALVRFLLKHKIAVHRANTNKVKYFVRSLGKLGKSDAIDAKALAQYGFERSASLELFTLPSRFQEAMFQLVSRRIELKQMRTQELCRSKAPEHGHVKASYEKTIKWLSKEIEQIDTQIAKLSEKDPEFKAKETILKSVPGIGEIIAKELLALLPELGKIDRRKIASLAGVAPHPNESGNSIGHRYTRGGRPSVKPILFMAAMTASRSKTRQGQFYHALLARGKKKMVSLVALMRKILTIANAKLRDYYKDQLLLRHS